jgi:Domain of unknown function (DUF6265)
MNASTERFLPLMRENRRRFPFGTTRVARRLRDISAVGFLILACSPVHGAAQAARVEDLRWLTGSWSMVSDGTTVEEHWTEAASNAILAVGRTVVGGRVVFFEFLRIEARPDGVFYVAQPRGAPPTDFRLTSWDGQRVIFENPHHDFPKRITYTRISPDSMVARVDGGEGVEQGAETIRYSRVRR